MQLKNLQGKIEFQSCQPQNFDPSLTDVFCIFHPQASDPDAGPNGEVRYRLLTHNGLFRINSSGAISTTGPLDREVRGHYQLLVEASDGTQDPRRTALTLLVTVLDVDDNSPVFSQPAYEATLAENSPAGTVILQLSVSGQIDL